MRQHLSSVQCAYLAGFIDGDGSIYVQAKPNAAYRYGFQIAPYVVLFQSAKNEQGFLKLCSMIGTGYTRKRNDGILEYIINRQEAILELLVSTQHYVVLKSGQIALMLKILKKKMSVRNEKDFKELLQLVDQFRELNYSKKRKRRLTP